jgi:hypothetical protein
VRLHEDEAELGGDFKDELATFAVAAGFIEGDELVGGSTGAAGDGGDAGVHGDGGGGTARRWGEEPIDRIAEFGSVFGDEADDFAIDHETVLADGGFDVEVLAWGNTDELGEFEVYGAEAVEEGDEVVGVAAAETEVLIAELAPRVGEGLVELVFADAANELDLGGGTASADGGEGTAFAEQDAEFEDGEGIVAGLRIVHRGSKKPKSGLR